MESSVKTINLYLLLSKLWKLVRKLRKIQFILLIFMMIFASFVEVITLGAVIPFLGVIASPDSLFEMEMAKPFIEFFDINKSDQLLVPFSLIFATSVIFSAVYRTILLHLNINVSYSTGSELSIDAFKRIINQPYLDHLNRNTSDLISIMGPKLNNAISVINNVLVLLSSIFIMTGILAILLLIQPVITLVLFSSFASIYIVTTFIFRAQLISNSKRISISGPFLVKTLQESLGGIRNIIIDSSQKEFINIYSKTEVDFRKAQANTNFVSNSPRPIMESLGIVLIILLAYIFSFRPEGVAGHIPILGFMALGAQRLLPTLQQAYAAWSYIKGEQRSLEDIIEVLEQPLDSSNENIIENKLNFEKKIHMKSISFRFSDDLPWVLRDFELEIEKGSWVGIIGETGSGKSTLIDIIMGLLEPTQGELYIDDELIENKENIKDWQSHIAHVPQVIFLSDTSISRNIAFGIHPDEIDHELVRKSAQIAQIEDTIISLPEGYDTVVGERGVRLSGGQRQRIGIARALYKQAEVIIFDEATNALDDSKESKVMKALENLDRHITIIIIAHRLSTLENCSKVINLDSFLVNQNHSISLDGDI